MPERDATGRHAHRVLVGDIGGTFARFALACDGALLNEPQRLERARWPDLASACRHYLAGACAGSPAIAGASIAAAGRVDADRIEMTNAQWSVDGAALADELGLRRDRVRVINDFAALAWVLPHLAPDELAAVPDGAVAATGRPAPGERTDGNRVVVGAGTGLGVAAALRTTAGWHPLATEGGHASFAAGTAFEHRAAELAARRFGRVSWERMLSGPGLSLLHEAARLEAGEPPPLDGAAAVLEGCARGEPAALRATRCFVELIGAFAGDLALLYDASGGVVIAGGVVPRIAALLPLDGLRERFEDKGRFAPWLRTVPVGVLTAPFAALRGAAIAYRC
jgi:glucokinase